MSDHRAKSASEGKGGLSYSYIRHSIQPQATTPAEMAGLCDLRPLLRQLGQTFNTHAVSLVGTKARHAKNRSKGLDSETQPLLGKLTMQD